jgi:Putative addiction module component
MSMPVEALTQEVMKLPTELRSRLLDQVIASLDTDRSRDAAWALVAAKRDAQLELGTEQALPSEAVLASLRAELA